MTLLGSRTKPSVWVLVKRSLAKGAANHIRFLHKTPRHFRVTRGFHLFMEQLESLKNCIYKAAASDDAKRTRGTLSKKRRDNAVDEGISMIPLDKRAKICYNI